MLFSALLAAILYGCSGGETPAGTTTASTGTEGATATDPAEAGTPTQEVVVVPGTGAVVSGTFAYAGTATGSYRVDVLKVEAKGGSPLIKALTLPEQGPWSVELPLDVGPVILNGFVDVGGLGPGHGEPSVRFHGVTVGKEAISGVELVLVDGGHEVGTPVAGTTAVPAPTDPSGATELAPVADGAAPTTEPLPPGSTPPEIPAPVAPADTTPKAP